MHRHDTDAALMRQQLQRQAIELTELQAIIVKKASVRGWVRSPRVAIGRGVGIWDLGCEWECG